MFKKWIEIVTADCYVIKLPNQECVYPIYKNGRSSLRLYATQNHLTIYQNKDLINLNEITVFLRDPIERFVSGVHTFIEFKDIINVNEFLKQVEQLKFYDRHFIPQIYWLLHLLKYFKGYVKLLPVTELYNYIPTKIKPPIATLLEERKQQILSINHKNYVNIDQKLIDRYLGKTIELKKIIEEFKYALSSS